ncbi:DNA repair protein RecN [Thermophilibacter provencensis]|uniref:DNA repair protein RecN n=1 Tax=Thermophilibacter provencensis TaxID=1852386 RepID=A0ABT7V468_9ACTN|nr:DNA repair protein RecN [Thermophilibacter provencensis]MDM8271390.1 DNA repair protein RecN [Thermophilibacter provencensis]
MIDELHVRDVALIHDATIEPAPGLTVLTGETGAGKTALLSSVKLLVGERSDAGMVREGAPSLEVEGRLFLRGDDEDGTVVRRRVGADGRGRVEINGHMASVRELAERVGSTVDLCGQHEHQRLLAIQSHVEMLDSWIGAAAADALAAYADALAASEQAASELERVREMSRATGERLEEAAFALRRIDEVDPREGELEELEAQLPRVEHGEALMAAASGARELLSGDDGVCDALSDAVRALEDAARFDPALGTWAKTLESSLIDIEDVSSELRDYADEVDFDPEELERIQTRLSRLEGLMRTYGPRMADVLERRERAREVVAAASDGGELERRAAEELERREAALAEAADALDAVRAEAAPRLAAAVTEQMALLEMGTAELEVSIERLPRAEWGRRGPSRVEFLYRPAAGLTARPLRKIASGGEVSRVMLACKVVLGEADLCETLVFDEVDAGVGGATAVALAGVLARLAATHQVIVVTHLAQVAVAAQRHYLVRKSGGDLPETSLVELSGEERVAEVARMLSGDTGEASRDLAREMLAARASRR